MIENHEKNDKITNVFISHNGTVNALYDSYVTYSIFPWLTYFSSSLQCCRQCWCHETVSLMLNSLCCHVSTTHCTRRSPTCLKMPPTLTPSPSSQQTPFPSPQTRRPTATPARPTAAQAVQPPSPIHHQARTQAAHFRCQVGQLSWQQLGYTFFKCFCR